MSKRHGSGEPPLACVNIPALPLQILLRQRPRWRGGPVAVVEEPGPDAPLAHLNEAARRRHARTGMRQATARNLVPDLRVGTVPAAQVRQVHEELTGALQTFSPRVEPDERFSGAFFVDPRGLSRIYGGPEHWAEAVHRFLRGRGLRSSVAIGYERYRLLAVARMRERVIVLDDERAERELSNAAPLELFELPAELRQGLARLDVQTIGDLVALPAGELHSRFGPEASAIQGLFASERQLPMQPRAFEEPVRVTLSVDPPDHDHARLLFAIKGALHELMQGLALRATALGALHVELSLEQGGVHTERIEPAAATRDAMTVLELVRLRLGDLQLSSAVEHIALQAEAAPAEACQLRFNDEGPKRDPSAADRALARLRAAWGPHAVTRAQLRDAHLPEARYQWEPIDRARPPRALDGDGRPTPPDERAPPVLVRRVLARPKPLPPHTPADPEAGPRLAPDHARVMYGPYRISGAWWVREVERDYYYAETEAGALLWLYFDRPRRRWFLHGMVD